MTTATADVKQPSEKTGNPADKADSSRKTRVVRPQQIAAEKLTTIEVVRGHGKDGGKPEIGQVDVWLAVLLTEKPTDTAHARRLVKAKNEPGTYRIIGEKSRFSMQVETVKKVATTDLF